MGQVWFYTNSTCSCPAAQGFAVAAIRVLLLQGNCRVLVCASMACAGGGSVLWIVQMAAVLLGFTQTSHKGLMWPPMGLQASCLLGLYLCSSSASFVWPLLRVSPLQGRVKAGISDAPSPGPAPELPQHLLWELWGSSAWGAPGAPLSPAPHLVCARCSAHPGSSGHGAVVCVLCGRKRAFTDVWCSCTESCRCKGLRGVTPAQGCSALIQQDVSVPKTGLDRGGG